MGLILLGFVLSLSTVANTTPYTMEDLVGLEQEKAHKELLRHAHDIRPSRRDASWKKILENAASSYLIQQTERGDFSKATYEFIQEISAWPTLMKEAYFHAKRDAYSLAYLKHCLKIEEFSSCQEKTRRAWMLSNNNRDAGVSLAETLADANEKEADIFFFTRETLQSEFGTFYCRRPFLLKAIRRSLHQEILGENRPPQVTAKIDALMGTSCFDVFSRSLKGDLENADGQVRDFAYKVLSSKSIPLGEAEDMYLTRYLLDAPTPGRIFNLAWAKLEEISRDHKRREILVEKLKAIDPLPDTLFRSNDDLKKKTMARFLYRTIPEFMDHYVEVCLRFLSGDGSFPRGNPTIHCNEFFKATEDLPLPEQQIRLRYSGLKRFVPQE